MESLKNFKRLKASSLVESVIAIAIISVCVLVGFMVYVNVIKQNDSTAYFNAKHKVDFFIQASIEKQDYESDNYTFDGYSISKEVSVNKEGRTALLEFTINTGNKTHKIAQLIPYKNE